jgi:beta-xylosidase
MSNPFPPTASSAPPAVRSSFAIRHWLVLLHILAAPVLCSLSLFAAQQVFTWTKPVTGGPDWIRDAYILRVGDLYYLTGIRRIASAPAEPGKWPGFYLWSSTDLLSWKEEGMLVSNEQVKWADRNFWGPEIRWHPRRQKFYLSFNARQMKDTHQLKLGMGLAVADKITGPYTLLTPDAAITDNNDASLFFDDDGTDYVALPGFNPASSAAQHARSNSLGSVLEQYGKP